MRKAWFIVLTLVFSASLAWAQGGGPALETLDQARQRHSAERYEIYKRRGYQAPLGGYPERLGDPAPPGTESPGLLNPHENPNPFPHPRKPGPLWEKD